MNCRCAAHSAFRFREFPRDSIFLGDPAFVTGAKSGFSMSHIQSATVTRITRETGVSPGTIRGAAFSNDAKRATEERQFQISQRRKAR